jgi:shikimate kinase
MKIFLIGFMGCGKTHWGRQLGQKLQIPFFDLDEKIVEQEGRSVSQIFEEDGEEYFRMLEKEILYMLTDGHETFVMATGGGTPCFYNNIDYLKQRGTVVWLNCPVECLYQRLVREKEQRPLLRKISDSELKSYIVRKFSNRKIFYQQAGVIIQEDSLTLDKLVSLIFHS